jgi:hypothetical protein
MTEIISDLASSDWKTRLSGIERLVNAAASVQDSSIGGGSVIQRLVDAIAPRLTDSNAKINVQALEALQVVLPRLRAHELGIHALTLVTALATNLAAQNPSVRALSEDALRALVALVAVREDIVAPLANQAQYANTRGRPFLVLTLADVLSDAAHVAGGAPLSKSMTTAVSKHVMPLLPVLLDDSKLDVKRALQALVQGLYRCMGPSLFSQPVVAKLQPAQMKRLEEMAQS